MSSEFSAFKAMAIGIAIVVAGVAVAPSVTGGQYDMLRLTKPRKGKTTTDTGGTKDRFPHTRG